MITDFGRLTPVVSWDSLRATVNSGQNHTWEENMRGNRKVKHDLCMPRLLWATVQ